MNSVPSFSCFLYMFLSILSSMSCVLAALWRFQVSLLASSPRRAFLFPFSLEYFYWFWLYSICLSSKVHYYNSFWLFCSSVFLLFLFFSLCEIAVVSCSSNTCYGTIIRISYIACMVFKTKHSWGTCAYAGLQFCIITKKSLLVSLMLLSIDLFPSIFLLFSCFVKLRHDSPVCIWVTNYIFVFGFLLSEETKSSNSR